jgi:hypothetical protein
LQYKNHPVTSSLKPAAFARSTSCERKKAPLAASCWPQENTITFYENLIVAIQKSSSYQQLEASSFCSEYEL